MTTKQLPLESKFSTEDRLTALLSILGWNSGTIHQVANALEVDSESLLHGKPESRDMASAHARGWFTVRTCSREHAMLNCFPNYKGNLDFWLGAVDGCLFPMKLSRRNLAADQMTPFEPPSRYLAFNPQLLVIKRSRSSAVKGKVTLIYAGIEVGQFDDEIKFVDGNWRGRTNSYWQKLAGKLFDHGDRKNQMRPIAETIRAVFGKSREPLYYEIPEVFEAFKDSPVASYYLNRVIAMSCPDTFHWTDYVEAAKLKNKYRDRPLESLTPIELNGLGLEEDEEVGSDQEPDLLDKHLTP